MDNLGASFTVPTEFVKTNGEILHQKIELKTDNHPGKWWKVKSERVGKRCFLTEGWSKFAEDVGLLHGECLVFTFLGDSAFNVSIYGVTCCKKLPCKGEDSGNMLVMVRSEDHDRHQEMSTEYPTLPTWKFYKEVKNYHYTSSRMDIPKPFAIDTGIAASRKMQLVDGGGRKWPVRVTDRNVGKYAMTSGWKDFLIGNTVAVGTTISFEFIPDSDNTVKALLI
ncbi:hypothetical protein C2S53_015263 [Perilla frutescens var. hirtella]|uniref:TF-B3 domain-containing protein n=1 Tax=Perilla frutescens var. hirtella TaxID=608512 RepID=A0AAD4ITC0_PERFH|nr:hypothetical protein C2S53_015263 [Perilla frutescens var. hirtella]